ncbi:MAG: hypothetical protein NT027_04145, partial [Proteobacteria bacterium]|nr:hypothetical protein [Pseudomonadota bacterium]
DSGEFFAREYWVGDSADQIQVDLEGYNYLRMSKSGTILEAYEFYEFEDLSEFGFPLPDLTDVNWLTDLGYSNFDDLEIVNEMDFNRIKELAQIPRPDYNSGSPNE